MSTRVDLETVITDHITAWTNVPCALIRDNEPSRTDNFSEWIRLTVGDGFSFLQESAGLLDITGSYAAHPFILTFDIFTPYNQGTTRAAEIGQEISDYWAYHVFGNVQFDAALFTTIGEEDTIYHTSVVIDAVRYERLASRRI